MMAPANKLQASLLIGSRSQLLSSLEKRANQENQTREGRGRDPISVDESKTTETETIEDESKTTKTTKEQANSRARAAVSVSVCRQREGERERGRCTCSRVRVPSQRPGPFPSLRSTAAREVSAGTAARRPTAQRRSSGAVSGGRAPCFVIAAGKCFRVCTPVARVCFFFFSFELHSSHAALRPSASPKHWLHLVMSVPCGLRAAARMAGAMNGEALGCLHQCGPSI